VADKVAAGPWSQVNAELIPAQNPGSVFGAVYEVLDTAVMPDTLIAYYLEDVDIHGASTFHGPISITLSAPAAATVHGFAARDASSWSLLGLLSIALSLALVIGQRSPVLNRERQLGRSLRLKPRR
jgi:hypothetical protein